MIENPLEQLQPTKLESEKVILEPLSLNHLEALYNAGKYESLWKLSATQIATLDDMKRYIETALREQDEKRSLPFVTKIKSSNEIVGSTRYANISSVHRRVEIGWTWITPAWQRTFVNTEAKSLMLHYAFEALRCIRVELKTDLRNLKSQNAMLRIGATREGVLRNHMIYPNGRLRDTVYFSILDHEWQSVKRALDKKRLGTL